MLDGGDGVFGLTVTKTSSMCGISGIINLPDASKAEKLTHKMLDSIIHRGPNSQGVWSTKRFSFGMRRLSIIDLPGGDQPIWADSGEGIVFNGEIYNFKIIRQTLEADGVIFKTHSDTEVILQLYLKKGIQAIHELEGMFSICLYDPNKRKVYLVRDRLGIKPLYYTVLENVFYFASEIKALIACIPDKPAISQQSFLSYQKFRYVPGPETIWSKIYKLAPGSFITYDIDRSAFNIEKYWSIHFNSQKVSNERNYPKEFESLFLDAVEKHLLASDVPVGILLSGGLDSSALAAAAVELGHKNFHTFSIGFKDGGEFSELSYARQVAEHLGSQHHETTIGQEEFISFLKDFVYYADEPLADLASVPLHYVSKLAAKHVKVVLSGEGADEILAGYNLDETAQHLYKLKKFKYIPKILLKSLPYDSLRNLGKYGFENLFKKTLPHITNIFSNTERNELFNVFSNDTSDQYLRNLYSETISSNPIDQLQEVYCRSWLVEDLLMKADKMTMANSLELRVPFLDHKLVEWAATLPLEWKVGPDKHGYTTKRVLRDFAAKRLPQAILTRPKRGFPVPAYQWMQKDLLSWSAHILKNPQLKDWVDNDKLSHLFEKASSGQLDATHKLWNLIIYSLWMTRWEN